MKKFLIWCLLCPMVVFGQKLHTVTAKETLFSIGRLYSVHPRELAAYNNIPFETGLTIGQVIKIPAKTSMPALPKENAVPAETKPVSAPVKTTTISVPVYHVVAPKETLYQISKKSKATVAEIKKWNSLSSDALKPGTKLIVGHKKEVKNLQEAVTTKMTTIIPEKQIQKQEEKPAAQVKKEEQAKEVSPVAVSTKVIAEEKPPAIEKTAEPVKETVVVPPSSKPVQEEKPKSVTPKNIPGEGFFSSMYAEQVTSRATLKDESGTAAVFKSTSGWEDGKYYCLYNKAEPGTIIKITNKETQKSVYAKVLDVMPDMKQNAGILIRISHAAADKLGVSTESFECIITY